MTSGPVSAPVSSINTAHTGPADIVSATEMNAVESLCGLAAVDNAAVVANISAATLIASAAVVAGSYIVSGTSTVTTAGTSGAQTLNVIYTDPDTNAAKTLSVASVADITQAAPQYANGVVAIRAKVGVAIQYSVSGLTTPGALLGAIHIQIRQAS